MIKQININGTSYLGKISVNGDVVTLSESTQLTHTPPSEKEFMSYLQEKNLDNLSTAEFSGAGMSYFIVPLSDAQRLTYKVCKMNMKRAKAIAVAELENHKLSHLLGKQ